MSYGVVACPACRHAVGADLAAKTVTCARCGKRHEVARLVPFFRTDDAALLADAVGEVEAILQQGGLGLVAEPGRLADTVAARIAARAGQAAATRPPPVGDAAAAVLYAASRAAGAQGDQVRAERVLAAIAVALPDGFKPEELAEAFAAAGLPAARAEQEIRRAIARNELYEPRPGVLRRAE